jgi:hypothetical protein
MRLHIHCRTDVNWAAMTLESYRGQVASVNLTGSVLGKVKDGRVIEVWQEAYWLDYFAYRATLKQTCRDFIVEHVASRNNVRYGSVNGYDDSTIVVPVDDDDVIAPQVYQVIDYFNDPTVNIVTWNRDTSYHGKPPVTERQRYYLDTCNYAIRTTFLQTFNIEDQSVILNRHQFANRIVQLRMGIANDIPGAVTRNGVPLTLAQYLEANREKTLEGCPGVIDVQKSWSTYYLHTGSISWLGVKGDLTVNALRALPLHPLFDVNVYNEIMRDRDVRATA